MRMRNKPGAEDELKKNPHVIFGPEDHNNPSGHWHHIFNNSNPIHLEIGTGKGKFIMDMAELYPEINFIAIEKIEEVLLFPARFAVKNQQENLMLIYGNAQFIDEYFSFSEVERIYINFPDPWLKKKHYKRRLTHHRFLERYKKFLQIKGEIHFKTDNLELFNFSLEELPQHGFEIKNFTYDLHNSKFFKNNVITGYEQRWIDQGKQICRLVGVWTGK